jgi:hypothetical protein
MLARRSWFGAVARCERGGGAGGGGGGLAGAWLLVGGTGDDSPFFNPLSCPPQ